MQIIMCVSSSKPVKQDVCVAQGKRKKKSVAWARERTIPTERPPLVGEVSVNFWE
jgi:hypothetical protein